MYEDWSTEGDLGLGKKSKGEVRSKNENSSRLPSEPASCGCCDNRPRKAVIRTLSGSWVHKQSEDKLQFRRRSYGGGQEGQLHDQQRRSSLAKRNGSIICCPDVLKKLKRRIGNHLAKGACNDMEDGYTTQERSDAEGLLKEANLTISALQSKLDIYEELLYGKSKASEVLLNQLKESVRDRASSEEQWRIEVREQRLEASRLQFQLLSFEGNLTDTQRAWLDRINNVVKENSELQSTVQAQGRVIRRLSCEKTAWQKECHELYSKEDARERRVYQRSNSVSEVGASAEQTILELAILGSCACRTKNQAPCACAKSACRRHQEVANLQKKGDIIVQLEHKNRELLWQVSKLEIQKDEMQRLMEIYKEAFEEQLERTRTLTKKVAQLDRENELAAKSNKFHALLRLAKDPQSGVINSLVDVVCDRTDALLQQQILTKLLSRRLTELENNNCQS